jgi:hypothetical protein
MNQRTKLTSALLAFALVFSLTAWSQETHPSKSESGQTTQDLPAHNAAQATSVFSYRQSPERFFRLNFRVLDLSPEGKVTNSRAYTETIATGPKSERKNSIRTDDRVPANNTYMDIGTRIDTSDIELVGETLHLRVTVNMSSMPASEKTGPPLIRNAWWDSYVTVPINKPTIIFSSDNSADRGKTELELTAVPINQ